MEERSRKDTPARVFQFLSLPDELQVRILEYCDVETLYNMCHVSKEICDKARPLLWEAIDFVSLRSHGDDYYFDDVDADKHKRFLQACEETRQYYPDRWAILSALPRLEVLARARQYRAFGGTQRINIVAGFRNVEVLTLFVKGHGYIDEHQSETCKWVEASLSKLKDVSLGGEIPRRILYSLLSRPEQMESLSLINIVTKGYDWKQPKSLLFLKPIDNRFTKLQRLHLSKLAGMYEETGTCSICSPSSQGFPFDVKREKKVLREWASLLARVSPTLRHLTLENCYYVEGFKYNDHTSFRQLFDRTSDDEKINPFVHRKNSSNTSRDILGPAMAACQFPKLESLVLIGMETFEPLPFLDPKVTVKYRPSSFAEFYDIPARILVSPPAGAFQEDPFHVTRVQHW